MKLPKVFDRAGDGTRETVGSSTPQPTSWTEIITGRNYQMVWLAAWIITFMIGFRAWQDHRVFLRHQSTLVSHSVDSAARQIQLQISELRRATQAFAEQNQSLLQGLLAAPNDLALLEELESKVTAVFPEYMTLSLADSRGQVQVEDLSGMVGDVCQVDIRHFAGSFDPTDIYMHPQSGFPHFDIMAHVDQPKRLPGVFLLSFSPDLLAQRLAYDELPGHELMLLRRDIKGLVDLTSEGVVGDSLWRKVLNKRELAELFYTREVPGTRWNVADREVSGYFASHKRRTWVGALFEIVGVFLAAFVMVLFVRRFSRKQRQLEFENARLASFPRRNPNPIIAFDRDANVVLVNPATETWMEFFELTEPTALLPEGYREELRAVPNRGVGAHRILERTIGSMVFEWEFHDVEEVGLVYGYGNNVTDRIQAEEQAEQHMNDLAHAGRLNLLGELSSGIAHEINQPLAAIRNYLSGVRMRLERGQSEGVLTAISKATEQAERAGQIVRNMRELARNQGTTRGLEQLNEIVPDVLEVLGQKIKKTRARIILVLDEDLPLVPVDRIQIEQVMINLVKNACESVAGSELREVTLTSVQDGEFVRFCVRDTGTGLTDKVRDTVFHPFFTTRENGLGLGLSISKTIIDNHGGELVAEHCDDNDSRRSGARFCLSLPLHPED